MSSQKGAVTMETVGDLNGVIVDGQPTEKDILSTDQPKDQLPQSVLIQTTDKPEQQQQSKPVFFSEAVDSPSRTLSSASPGTGALNHEQSTLPPRKSNGYSKSSPSDCGGGAGQQQKDSTQADKQPTSSRDTGPRQTLISGSEPSSIDQLLTISSESKLERTPEPSGDHHHHPNEQLSPLDRLDDHDRGETLSATVAPSGYQDAEESYSTVPQRRPSSDPVTEHHPVVKSLTTDGEESYFALVSQPKSQQQQQAGTPDSGYQEHSTAHSEPVPSLEQQTSASDNLVESVSTASSLLSSTSSQSQSAAVSASNADQRSTSDIRTATTSVNADSSNSGSRVDGAITLEGAPKKKTQKKSGKTAKRRSSPVAQSPRPSLTADRESPPHFLASYPPPHASNGASSLSFPLDSSVNSTGHSVESFTEYTPLLESRPSKKGKSSRTDSAHSLTSSSTLSLFLASLKVNTGSTSNGKNPLGVLSSRLLGSTRTPTTDYGGASEGIDNPLLHPLATSSGSLSFESSRLMPTHATSVANASIPLEMVSKASKPPQNPVLAKMNLLQRANTVTGIETGLPNSQPVTYPALYGTPPSSGTTTLMNPLFNGNGSPSLASQLPTAQQRYMQSLLDTGETAQQQPKANGPANGSGTSSTRNGGAQGTVAPPYLSYKPYPNPKSSTAPAMSPIGGEVTPADNGALPRAHAAHCRHHPSHPYYGSSGSFAGGHSHELTTDDDSSLSSSVAKHDNTFSLKFPKLRYLKVALLSGLIIYTLISFISIQEKEDKWSNVAVQQNIPAYVDLSHSLDLMFPVWKLRAKGSFLPAEYAKLTNYSVIFTVVQLLNDSQGADRNGAYRLVKGPWAAPIAPPKLSQYMNTEVEHTFKLSRGDAYDHIHRYQLRIDTNAEESVGLTVNMAGFSELSADGIILAISVLIFLYTLIIFEIVNRTLAAMLGATAAITCLTLIRDRPSLEKVVSWLDVETLCLLFGMMVLVAILCETGFFDYIAIVAFKIAKGRTWPLIFTLCIITGVLSAFLDNVTTILLMTPITIRLCEIKNIDPKLVLIAQVMFSNIGGAATPVGDPPNVIIISSAKIQQQGVDFGRFTLHMMPGIIFCFAATLIYIRICYRSLSSNDLQEGNGADTEEGLTVMKHVETPMTFPQSGTGALLRQNSRSQSEPQFAQVDPLPNASTATIASGENRTKTSSRNKIPTRSPNQLLNPLESSSDFDSYSFSQKQRPTAATTAAARTRMLRSYSGAQGKDAGDPACFSCNSMDDFCAGTSIRDSILDERRVFRSGDELQREIEVWKRATNSISGYSRDENSVRNVLNHKVEILETILQEQCYETVPPEDNYASILAELEEKYKIRDYPLLYKSGVVMVLVISLFFMQSIPNLDLSLGWIAILGAILLLVLADRHELESIISRVEWSTLIFFAALFVVMEALAELKFLWWIGRLTQDFINSVPEAHRLVVAILLFTWISALASCFIDNIPLTTVMVKILEDLSENNEFNIPLVPLIYALAFGACLGGNGTLIGASSNVVCSGVAEQHGYRFTFMEFFKVGFPIMLITVSISSVYLIVCHVIFDWNY